MFALSRGKDIKWYKSRIFSYRKFFHGFFLIFVPVEIRENKRTDRPIDPNFEVRNDSLYKHHISCDDRLKCKQGLPYKQYYTSRWWAPRCACLPRIWTRLSVSYKSTQSKDCKMTTRTKKLSLCISTYR